MFFGYAHCTEPKKEVAMVFTREICDEDALEIQHVVCETGRLNIAGKLQAK